MDNFMDDAALDDFIVENGDCNAMIMSEETLDIFVPIEFDFSTILRNTEESCIQRLSRRYAIIYTRPDNLIVPQPAERYYGAAPKCHGLMDTFNLEAMGVSRLRRQPNFDLYGRGVIIGFVDTGIDYTNALFQNRDGTTRILSIWDQTVNTAGEISYMGYGRAYTQEEINAALQSGYPQGAIPFDQSVEHGTFLAAAAAGNEDSGNNFSGVASLADIAVVRLKPAKKTAKRYFLVGDDITCYQENDIALGVKFLYNLATSRKQPLIICVGLGTNQGGHTGWNVLEDYLDEISNVTGVCTVVPAGNEAASRGHFHSTEGIAAAEYEDVELRVGEGEAGFFAEIWASSPQLYNVEIISPGGEHFKPRRARTDTNEIADFVFEGSLVSVNNYIQLQEAGDQLIFLRFYNPAPGIWTLRVLNDAPGNTGFHVWLPIEQFLHSDTYFLRPSPSVTVTSPGNAFLPITVAAYNHVSRSIYIDSGRGFTRSGSVKPDLTAPGVNIYGPSALEGFTRKTGTSIAMAEVAGVAAMLMEWGIIMGNRPYMDTTEIKTLLIRGAVRTEIIYPNEEWGYGTVDIYGVFENLRRTV